MYILADLGRKEILNSYFQSTDLYLGLWYNSSTLYENVDTLALSGFFDEIVYPNEYTRLKIDKNQWTFNVEEQIIHTVSPIEFNPSSNVWSITGYFITDVATGNSGNLIDIDRFNGEVLNLTPSDFLSIIPKLTIY